MKKVSSLVIASLLLIVFALESLAQQSVVQTQPSSDGTLELALTEVKQKNDVVTVKAVLKNVSTASHKAVICYQDAYFIDPKENKKYMSLKDSEDASIAGPVDNAYYCKSGRLDRELAAGQQAILWVKFPAPASGASDIDISFPDFLPFEGAPIQK
ncbi:MAG: hypothetical protein MUE70_03415 [Desulfobacterales bacterium]|jgi:hypothetical protein|nr:hypothetical protein [Desulfobacterales bacterium]